MGNARFYINPFHAMLFFYTPALKTSVNQRFFDVFKGYRKIPVLYETD